jgi:hypothetical protein
MQTFLSEDSVSARSDPMGIQAPCPRIGGRAMSEAGTAVLVPALWAVRIMTRRPFGVFF